MPDFLSHTERDSSSYCVFITVRVDAQMLVNCFQRLNCPLVGPPSVVSTQAECCNHSSTPFGVAFQFLGREACNRCPTGKLIMHYDGASLKPCCVHA